MRVGECQGESIAKTAVQQSALIVILAGLLVLFGWFSHTSTLIQTHPSLVPMQFNTALAFLLSAISLIGIIYRFHRLGLLCALPVLALVYLILAEYVFAMGIDLDRLLMQHFLTVMNSQPGQMTPNTALCFSMTTISLLLALLPAIILTLGTMALVGYLSQSNSLFSWGQQTQMAIHTSSCLMQQGPALLAKHKAARQIQKDQGLKHIPVLVLTSSKEEDEIIRSYELGAHSFIGRPENSVGFLYAMNLLSEYWISVAKLPPDPAQAIESHQNFTTGGQA